jgi:hypothetical protein
MNQIVRIPESDGLMEPLDMLLTDVAIRVQLTAADHGNSPAAATLFSKSAHKRSDPYPWLMIITGWCCSSLVGVSTLKSSGVTVGSS